MSAIHTLPPQPPVHQPREPGRRTISPHAGERRRPWLSISFSLIVLLLLVLLSGLVLRKQKPPIARDTAGAGAVSLAPFHPAAEPLPKELLPENILALQASRQSSSVRLRAAAGAAGVATLINLNPAINAWYVLEISPENGASKFSYHLENARPGAQTLALDESDPSGIVILEGKDRHRCALFAGGSLAVLEQARNSQLIYAGLCGGRIYLRNPARGHRTKLEAAAEFLRDQVWGGEEVIILFHHLLQDSNREAGELHGSSPASAGSAALDVPLPASLDPKYEGQVLAAPNLEITVEGREGGGLRPGRWYPVRGTAGIFVSLLQPNFAAPEILQSQKALVNTLDKVEAGALAYLVAFDLTQLDLAFARGTDHPGVAWSDHMLEQERIPGTPGPDGIGNIAPLVSTGLINPQDARNTVAAFTAGFKRTHGAFKSGEFALQNHGSHYGFLEEGVVFSSLLPGLSTIFVGADGAAGMKTWLEENNRLLPGIRYARQNGVPLLEWDAASQSAVPGRLVNRWGPGNWSGSEDAELRTMRSGAAWQQNGAKNFLIYAVFTTATPSAMVRVFQAYGCRYAMLLDMNALEHTYLAVYRKSGSQLVVEHLISGMGEVDKSGPAGPIPRFLGFPDNRDFFYVTRRNR